MPAHEFEKNVQQKMEELKFTPSDAVWRSVEVEIRKNRRRRRFLLALPLLLVIGLASFWATHQNRQSSIANAEQFKQNHSENSLTHPAGTALPEPGATKQDQSEPGDLINKRTSVASSQPDAPVSEGTGAEPASKENHATPGNTGVGKPGNTIATRPSAIAQNHPAGASRQMRRGAAGKNTIFTNHKRDDRNFKSMGAEHSEPGTFYLAEVEKELQGAQKALLIHRDRPLINLSVSAPATGSNAAKKVIMPASRKWHFGITASVGISKLVDGTFSGAFEKALRPSNLNYADLQNARPGPVGLPSLAPGPSDIRPAAAAALGFFVKRDINKRFGISSGISYNYYSTSTKVGARIDSSRAVNSNAASLYVSGYYRNTGTGNYFNRYHFIEIPLSAELLINKNNKYPLIAQAGMSLGMLVGSNALAYDNINGVYYRDKSLFNTTQVGFHGALLLRLGKKHAFEIGPGINYKLGSLTTQSMGTATHLLSGAINARWSIK